LRARKYPQNHIRGEVAAYLNLVLPSLGTTPQELNRFLPEAFDK
jgi:hypothetical protein